MIQDRFFDSSKIEGKDYKLRYRKRSTEGLELKGITQIGYCEFKWVFRCEKLSPEEAAQFIKNKFINPLLCVVKNVQNEINYEEKLKLSNTALDITNVTFNKTSKSIMNQFNDKFSNEEKHESKNDNLINYDSGEDIKRKKEKPRIQNDNQDSMESEEFISNTFENTVDGYQFTYENNSDNEDNEQIESSEVEELQRRQELENKLLRLKRKREVKEQKARKKQKIRLL